MVDASVLRNMMLLLGDLAPKGVDIAPTADFLMRQAASLGHPNCALLMDGYNAKLMFTDMANDCAVVRTLPIGVMSLPAAVAQHTRVNLKKAQSGLEKRDIIATLDMTDDGRDADQRLSKSTFFDAMSPLLFDLKRVREATLR